MIVPLPEHLGLALFCVESLVRGQTYPRERFEVLVMTNGTEPALEKRVEALLGLEDRMIRHETTNLPLLYNLGARQAGGRLLFLTESHCIVEPECLEELVAFLAAYEYDGASCQSLSIRQSPETLETRGPRLPRAGFAPLLDHLHAPRGGSR